MSEPIQRSFGSRKIVPHRTLGYAVGAPRTNYGFLNRRVHIATLDRGRVRGGLCGVSLRDIFSEGVHLCPAPSCVKCIRMWERGDG